MRVPLFFFIGILLTSPCMASTQQEEYQKAMTYLQEDRYNQAIDVLQGILEKDPNQAPAYNLLGLIYMKQGESIESAIGSFEQAIHIDPKYADAYFNLASAYASQGTRPRLAVENFRKTLEADPNYVKAHFGLGWFILTTNEDAEEAAKHFQKAIDNFPDFAEAYYGLGLAEVQMGKSPLALKIVTQLRTMGREDLATYLESAIRGESLSESSSSEPPPTEQFLSTPSDDDKKDFLLTDTGKTDFLLDLSDQKTDAKSGIYDLDHRESPRERKTSPKG